MAVEDYDTGVTRKTIDEITEQDRYQARLRIDPTGTRWDSSTGWWNETFNPGYARGTLSPDGETQTFGGGGYYAIDPVTGERLNPNDFEKGDYRVKVFLANDYWYVTSSSRFKIY